jgi:hypothetical protein
MSIVIPWELSTQLHDVLCNVDALVSVKATKY